MQEYCAVKHGCKITKAKKDAVPFQKSGKKTKSRVPLVGDACNPPSFAVGELWRGKYAVLRIPSGSSE